MDDAQVIATTRRVAQPLRGSAAGHEPLFDMIGDARCVLIGEASHGTHEFYAERAAITRRLIERHGFTAVAVEADWPDAYRVNCYVRNTADIPDANDALSGFKRFPQWMWRNTVVLDFVQWLRAHNDRLPGGAQKAGFYGLDLYSLHASIDAVLGFLQKVDPEAARRARDRYGCFEHFGRDPQRYGYMAQYGRDSCEDEVIGQLVEIQRRAAELAERDGAAAEDDYFYAEQNARLAKNAEAYYRSMYAGRISSWNLRDQHMAETLDRLLQHLNRHGDRTKFVVWAHNSHLGDARATEMGQWGELNLGQLVRERYGDDARLIGFSTHTGTVSAAADWDEPVEWKRVNPSLPRSYERIFHESGIERFVLPLRAAPAAADFRAERLQRAIGVIYRPETERQSHYFNARLADQFDALIHIDTTHALEPLERTATWQPDELPETFPSSV